MVLLPGIPDLKTAQVVAAKIMEGVSTPSADITDQNGEPLVLKMAVGISIFPGDGESTDEMIAVADSRMYTNKAASR